MPKKSPDLKEAEDLVAKYQQELEAAAEKATYHEVTTAREYFEPGVPGCAVPSTVDLGAKIAADAYVEILTDDDFQALAKRGIDPRNLTPDRTNETYRPLFQHGNGSYFVVVDFGNATFQAILVDSRAEKRIALALTWGSRLDRFLSPFRALQDWARDRYADWRWYRTLNRIGRKQR